MQEGHKFTLQIRNVHHNNIVVSLHQDSFIINIFSLSEELVYTSRKETNLVCSKGPLINPKRLSPNEVVFYDVYANFNLEKGEYKAVITYRMDHRLIEPTTIMFEIS